MKIYDSVKKQKVNFIPIKDNEVKIYVCGPTVYDDAHLGHARSSIAFDLLRRVLIELKYKVIFVKNFTDIDDKIIKKAKETSQDYKELTKHYIDSYLSDMNKLNVLKADVEPLASETLNEMFNLIQTLLDKDFAYKIDNGDIYFDTSKDEKYLSISNKIQDENDVIHRVELNLNKKNARDFALWKAKNKNDEIYFHSPFGDGRPGWHLECSAMIDKYLNDKSQNFAIDIHCGGADLLFPHHENEATQSRCANNQELAKYWLHNGFVNINGEKMSKSLGNSFFIKNALKNYDGEILRFYLISTHYRADLHFNEEDLINAKKRLDKLYRLKKRIYGVEKELCDKDFEDKFLNSLRDDLNISLALAGIEEMISEYNENLDKNPKDKTIKQKIISNIKLISRVLGVGGKDGYQYFQLGVSEEEKIKIDELIEKRNEAKKDKNYELADIIRGEILQMGIEVMDTSNGTLWEKV